jgi:hypothetical protein
MNIIQIQDRLKGLPDEALVNYVEQPMGEVPIYLALGELQRRKEMRERFRADQMPPPSVAEQLVAEAKPKPVGIAAMAPQRMMPGSEGVGAPQPAPQMDPRQMAASGIAANPVSNVGGPAMMAEGGIVGYQTGGSTGYSDEFIKMLEEQARRGEATGGPYGGSIAPDYGFVPSNQLPEFARQFKDSLYGPYSQYGKPYGSGMVAPGAFVPFGKDAFTGDIYGDRSQKKFSELDFETPEYKVKDDKTGKFITMPSLSNREAEEILKAEEAKAAKDKEIQETKKRLEGITGGGKKKDAEKEEPKDKKDDGKPDLSADDKVRADLARIKRILGEDPDRQALKDRLADKEDRALNMALIRGGLGIAAGQSANFLENLAKGTTAGVESYAKTQEDILEAQSELAKQKRAEDLALLGKALDAEQSELDRASKETIAKYMSPTGGFNIVNKVLSNPEVEKLMGKIQLYKGIENPTKEQQAELAKFEAELLALQQKLFNYYQSQGFGAGTGQTSSNDPFGLLK